MASLNLDFSSVPSREPLPEGVYELAIDKVENVVSKSTNKPMLKVTFNVLTEGYIGRKLFSNYVLADNCLWKVKELFDSIGMDSDAIVDIDTDDLVGMTCSAKVGQRTYNDEVQNEIVKTL